jgi:hypothetical protein
MSMTFCKAKNRFSISEANSKAQTPTMRDQNHSGSGNGENFENDHMVGTEFISADDFRIMEQNYSNQAIPSIDINAMGINLDIQKQDSDTPTKNISNSNDTKVMLKSDITSDLPQFISPSFNKEKLPKLVTKESNRFLSNQQNINLDQKQRSINRAESLPEIFKGKEGYLNFREK